MFEIPKAEAVKVYTCDFLVVGGGDAGCSAAIEAAENGVDTIILEKANTARSGHSGMGMDHVMDFPREGVSNLEYVKFFMGRHELLGGPGALMNPNVGYILGAKSWWALEKMERWGYPMRWEDDDYHWVRNGWFGKKIMIGVHWLDVKPVMAKKCKEVGVRVLDRTMMIDLLTDSKGKVCGATAINVRTGEFSIVKAKAVMVSTCNLARNYTSETPMHWKYKMRYHGHPGSISGDGFNACYKVGAGLANMDIATSWNYRIRDDITLPFGSIDHGDGIRGQWMNAKGEPIPFPTAKMYDEIEKAGLDPIYCTIEHFNEDYQKRNEICIADERFVSLYLSEQRGFNPQHHRYELMENRRFGFYGLSGVFTDENFKTEVEGLYCGGDTVLGLGGCGSACISGIIVGNQMKDYCAEAPEPEIDYAHIDAVMRQPNLMVNKFGERFYNEGMLGNGTFATNAINLQKDKQCFIIMDESIKRQYRAHGLDLISVVHGADIMDVFEQDVEAAVANHYPHFFKADTIEELCEQTGIDLDGLTETLETYNEDCQGGRDTLFAKDYRYMKPLKKGPYYAARFCVAAYGSLGGIKINHKTEVIREDFSAIKGLYAAGSDACSIYGDSYVFQLTGNTMGFALNSGRIAGEEAAEFISKLS